MRRLDWAAAVCGVWLAGSAAAASEPYAATRDRPLFSATRRPPPRMVLAPPSVEQPAPQPPAPPPALTLSGVIFGPGTSVALLTRPGSAESVRVVLGGRIDGWRVAEIRPRSVVLTLDERRVTVTLPDAAGPVAPPPAPQL